MTKTRAPLLSLGAHGKVGPHLTFRRSPSGVVAQKVTAPTDRRTPAQLAQRDLWRTIVAWWNALLPASRAVYAAMDTSSPYFTGYTNFLRYQIMHQLVDHHEQHEKAQADPLRIEKQDSSTVGPSGTPLFNFVELTPANWPLDTGMTSTTAWAALDLSAIIPPSAIAVLLHMEFMDNGSAAAECYGALHGTPVMIQEAVHGYHVNAKWTHELVLLAPISNQEIYWRVLATGVNTARLILALHGWFEKAEE